MSTQQFNPWAPASAPTQDIPDLRVVRGEATKEELAALFAVIMTEAGAREQAQATPPSTRGEILRRAAAIRGRLSTLPGLWRRR